MEAKANSNLPPGFRFHPTDEELIIYYLRNQAMSRPCPVSIIPAVDIYEFDPWELPEKAEFGENEWYFFTPRRRKYPNGVRPNRATVSGYWKATGTDKAIYSSSKYVGVKKALVFYKGRPPKGTKSNWIMHEYRLSELVHPVKQRGSSMRLDDWVLCRIYKKRHVGSSSGQKEEEEQEEDSQVRAATTTNANNDASSHNQQQALEFPRTFSLAHLLEMDYLGPISHLLNDNDNPFHSAFEFQTSTGGASSDSNGAEKAHLGELPYNTVI